MSDANAIEPAQIAELEDEIDNLNAEIRRLEIAAAASTAARKIAELEDEIDNLNDEIQRLEIDAAAGPAALAADFTAFCTAVIDRRGPLPLALRLQAEAIATAMGAVLPRDPRHREGP